MRTIALDAGFVEYVRADEQRLGRLAFTLTGHRQDAEDLVQDTLLRLARYWGRIDERGPHGYATATMCRLAARRRATRVVPTKYDPETPTGSAGSSVDAVSERLALLSGMRTLAPRQRAVLALRYFCDYSVQETAEVLGCSTGTVKSQTSKALRTLRTHLATANAAPASTSKKSRTSSAEEKP